jgi:hypothetical protein
MRVLCLFTILYGFTHVTNALYAGKYCSLACETSIDYVTFNDTDAWLSRKVRQCRSELRIASLYLCFDEYCADGDEVSQWIEDQTSWCEEHAGVTLTSFHEVVTRITPDERARIKRLPADEALQSPSFGEILIPDGRSFERAFTTLVRLPTVSDTCENNAKAA